MLAAIALTTYTHIQGFAAAPVEEIGSGGAPSGRPVTAPSVPTSSVADDPYYRLQLIQEELRQLRGMLEEQAYAIEQLQKRQREDYLDLDRRLTAGLTTPDNAASTATSTTTIPPAASAARGSNGIPVAGKTGDRHAANSTDAAIQANTTERAAYEQAYALLKTRQVNEAKTALQKFLVDYPEGAYVANAQYWLGEVHLLENDLDAAALAFGVVVERYPAHRKASDATFKLGKVYHLQQQPEKARAMLEQAALGSDSAAKLAQDYLKRHF